MLIMKASVCRAAVLLILIAATTVNSEKVLRRRRAKVVEVESSSAFVESLWESEGIHNEQKPMKELPKATTVDVKKETREEKVQKIEEDAASVERILMGEARMVQEMSMSFYVMF